MSSLYENHHDGPTAEPRSEETEELHGLELMAMLAQKSARDLAFTTNALEANLRDQVRSLARTVIAMDQTLSEATVIDRLTESRLRGLSACIDSAYITLEHLDGVN